MKSTNADRPLDHGQSRQRTNSIMLALTAAASLWFLLPFFLYWLRFHNAVISDQGKDWGDFGVFVGGLAGTGIAAVTLYAVAYGIRVQAEDLAKSREFMAKQSATMAQEAFDSVFFKLLDTFSQVRDSVSLKASVTERVNDQDVPDTKAVYERGRLAFEEFYSWLFNAQVGCQKTVPDRLTVLQNLFLRQYAFAETELGPYFRTLYQVFKWIDRATVTEKQKIDYAKIARAQLSDSELRVIFYDGVTDLAVKFKPLIEKYGLLKHINTKKLLLEDDKRNPLLYEAKAFE